MTLDVERSDGVRYEVQDRWMVAGDEPVTVGSELAVLVDPERRGRIAIDWERTREIRRRKGEERRELLTVGVPVPVAKVHQEAEARGLIDPAPPVPAAVDGRAPEGEPPPQPLQRAGDELIDRLERLAALHAAGALTDDEFTAVKRHLIG